MSTSAITLDEAIKKLGAARYGLSASSVAQLLRTRYGVKATPAQVKEKLAKETSINQQQRVYNARSANTLRRFDETVPNLVQHADLLDLPNDRGYRRALVVVDSATRYKAVEPLKGKTAEEVEKAFEHIYKTTPLDPPGKIMFDSGSEFKGAVERFFEKHKTNVSRGVTGDHRHAALAEAANRVLARRLFAHQYQQEEETGKTNREWVEQLPEIMEAWNELPTRAIGIAPKKAMEQEVVKHKPRYGKIRRNFEEAIEDQTPLSVGTMVRIPKEKPDDGGAWRATDRRFTSPKKITNVRWFPDMPIEYQVDGGGGRWFTEKNFQL